MFNPENLQWYNWKIQVKPSSEIISTALISRLMEYKYSDITARIIRVAMNVHSITGNGFQELIYQRSLEVEFGLMNISFGREVDILVFYKNVEVGGRRVDFLVENKISVELKALVKLEPVHLAQAKNYLEAFNLEVGLLINFGATSLEWKRLYNNKYKK